jgi:subtilisin family serine protease
MQRVLAAGIAAFIAGLAYTSSAGAAPVSYDARTLIVKYADGTSSSQRSLTGRQAGVLETLGAIRAVDAEVVRVSGDPAAVAARLNRSGNVLYAEPNSMVHASGTPNDPRFGELYALQNTRQTGGTLDADIDAPQGWTALFGFTSFPATGGAKIGIVDTGVMARHEDLAGKVVNCVGVRSPGSDVRGLITPQLLADPTIVAGRCVDDNGHGTHVAGTAAATANNARGIAGVAFNSPLAICKALGRDGGGAIAGVANCIGHLAANGAKVISLSSVGRTSRSRCATRSSRPAAAR